MSDGFILNGAPFTYRTTNILVCGLFPGSHGLLHVFAADYPTVLSATSMHDDGRDHVTDGA
jgi:hypothetical protein